MRDIPGSGSGVSLRRLLPDATIVGAADIRVMACSSDSRTVRAGDLFVAIDGATSDGHDFVPQAVAKGAASLLVERVISPGQPYCLVDDTREAYGRICQALAGNPSHRVKTIGVTGTNGKTTTSTLIASVLRAAGCRFGLMGTLGHWDGADYRPAHMTTPSAPELADSLSRMEANGCSHAVIEVSSHALSQRRTAGIVLDAACVTNVRRDHLDYHRTLQNYRAAKARLFDHLSPEGFAVVNGDCSISQQYLLGIENPALTVSLGGAGEVTATIVERSASEQTFLITAGDETAAVASRMIGDHHVSNALIAAAVGLVYGIDLPTIARGIASVDQVPGRLERIDCGQPFSVYVDYAHTPDALLCALNAVRHQTTGRVFCVFGAGGERDKEKRPQMGVVVEELADMAILTNDNPRCEPPKSIIKQILSGFDAAEQVHVELDRKQAIAWALSQAEEGDCVLIAGKGHEEHQIIGRRRLRHDDRQVARDWLYANATMQEFRPTRRLSA